MSVQEIRAVRRHFCGMLALAKRQKEKGDERMAEKRFVEIYSQGATNVEKIIVDRETGVNYLLAASTLTPGCGMSI